MAARDALARNETSTVRRMLGALQELVRNWVVGGTRARRHHFSPRLSNFRNLWSHSQKNVEARLYMSNDAAARNKPICDEALRRFRDEIKPALDRLAQLLPPDHHFIRKSREEAARCLSSIAINFTWADEFVTSEKLQEEALKLAGEGATAIAIESTGSGSKFQEKRCGG